MKKSCLIWFLVYLACAGCIYFAVSTRLPGQGNGIAPGLIGGFFLWMGIAYIVNIRLKFAEGSRVKRSMRGDAPRDGERIAAIGRIEAIGPTLRSPFTNTPCVAYQYTISSHGGKSITKHYDGFALTPSAIRTAGASVRILAYPELDFPSEHPSTEEASQNAERFVQETQFTSYEGLDFKKAYGDLKTAMADDDGTIRIDTRIIELRTEMNQCMLEEKIVAPGEPVCAFGLYSSKRQGFVPDPSTPIYPVKVTKGDASSILGKIRRSIVGHFIGGLILITSILGGLTAFYALVPLSAAEQMSSEKKVNWYETRLEHFLERNVRPLLREKGIGDTGIVTTNLTAGAARGVLQIAGTDVTLSNAYRGTNDGKTIVVISDRLIGGGYELDEATLADLDVEGLVLTLDGSRRVERVAILHPSSAGAAITPVSAGEDFLFEMISESAESIEGRVSFAPLKSPPGGRNRIRFRSSFHAVPVAD